MAAATTDSSGSGSGSDGGFLPPSCAAAGTTTVRIRPATRARDFEAIVSLKHTMNIAEHDHLPLDSPIRPVLDLSEEAARNGVEAYFSAVEKSPSGAVFVAELVTDNVPAETAAAEVAAATTTTTEAAAVKPATTTSLEDERRKAGSTTTTSPVVVGSVLWFEKVGNESWVAAAQRVGMIRGVVVAEAVRGQGIGKRLMARAEESIRAAGIRHAYLEVTYDNTPAKALYRSAGFSNFEVVMLKTLT